MVSYRHKCIFVEVPKTGSTSIRKIIGSPIKAHMDIIEIKKKIEQNFPFDCKAYTLINNIYSITTGSQQKKRFGESVFSTYFKFGFVRNPWARTVSLYLRQEGMQMYNQMTFKEFVDWIQHSSDTCVHPTTKKNQLDWFTDYNGKTIVDYIGKFENLDSDWDYISKILKISQPLPHLNRNERSGEKHYTEYYNDQTKEIIRKKFIVDIEYFEYSFNI